MFTQASLKINNTIAENINTLICKWLGLGESLGELRTAVPRQPDVAPSVFSHVAHGRASKRGLGNV